MNLLRFIPKDIKRRFRERAGAVTLEGRMRNLRRAGFIPRVVVDAGAFRGEWTREVLPIFPEAEFLLIEPQLSVRPALRSLADENKNIRLRHHLLGRVAGEVRMLVEGSNSRILPSGFEAPPGAAVESHRIETLAEALAAEGFQSCDLLKLDLQGHELEALAGAGDLFGRIEVIMCEVSWLRIGDVPILHEVVAEFVARGYRPYDVLGQNYRRLDRALWQTDVIFVREDSVLLASNSWS